MYGGDHRTVAPITSGQVDGWYRRVQEAFYGWAIEVDGTCIGSVRLHDYDKRNKSVRFSIGLFAPQHCGKGYGTEATQLVLDFAFSALDVHRIELRVLAYNRRAIRCYEKCGFQREGILRDGAFVAGGWEDDVVMSILETEQKEHD